MHQDNLPDVILRQAQDVVYAHPARILTPQHDIERMVSLVEQKHVVDPGVLSEANRELFFFSAEISNDRLDSYFTRMALSSLRNYAAEAAEGVSFQNSHKWNELGFGRSLTGDLEAEGERSRVLAWFYTLSGLKLNDLSTDDLIAGIRAGIVKDVSIGFHGGRFDCDICGRDMLWDWDCQHIPGLRYEIEEDGAKQEQLAFAWVEDAHLAEVSAVFDGANPGAAIIKAEREAEAGRISKKARTVLEQRYRIALPGKRQTWQGVDIKNEPAQSTPIIDGSPMEEIDMNLEQITRALGELAPEHAEDPAEALDYIGGEIRRLLVTAEDQRLRITELEAEVETAEARLTEITATNAELENARTTLEAQIAELEPLAEQGHQYRQDLIEQAKAEGIRALGDDFDADVYDEVLGAASLTVIKRMRDDWKKQGDAIFRSGRKTKDEHQPPEQIEKPDVPDAAFQTLPPISQDIFNTHEVTSYGAW